MASCVLDVGGNNQYGSSDSGYVSTRVVLGDFLDMRSILTGMSHTGLYSDVYLYMPQLARPTIPKSPG